MTLQFWVLPLTMELAPTFAIVVPETQSSVTLLPASTTHTLVGSSQVIPASPTASSSVQVPLTLRQPKPQGTTSQVAVQLALPPSHQQEEGVQEHSLIGAHVGRADAFNPSPNARTAVLTRNDRGKIEPPPFYPGSPGGLPLGRARFSSRFG